MPSSTAASALLIALLGFADLSTAHLGAGAARRLAAPPSVPEVDIPAYVGRWYNVYYDKFTTLFSSPDCATAYYSYVPDADVPTISVNNSGTEDGEPTYILGSAFNDDAPCTPSELVLRLDGVPQDATYHVIGLGPKVHGTGYYAWSMVTDNRGYSLYVLARDVDEFFEKYDDDVKKLLDEFGYTGFIWGVKKNKQDDECPRDLIEHPQWSGDEELLTLPSVPEEDAEWRASQEVLCKRNSGSSAGVSVFVALATVASASLRLL